ncbi:hypothetical protein ACFQ0M_47595 [Kitasatospora aburaviensis]
MIIAVINHSTLITDDQVQLAVQACAAQVQHHVSPHWGVRPITVVAASRKQPLPPGAAVIGIFDDADQEGALGWHTEDSHGTVYGKVFARPVLDNGGQPLHGALSVSAVLSHEVLETYLDPAVQLWAQDGHGVLWAYEICDPVEDSTYEVKVAGQPVAVSNFVLPAWFDAQAPAHTPVDYLEHLQRPFEVAAGGYAVRMHAGDTPRASSARRSPTGSAPVSSTDSPERHAEPRPAPSRGSSVTTSVAGLPCIREAHPDGECPRHQLCPTCGETINYCTCPAPGRPADSHHPALPAVGHIAR